MYIKTDVKDIYKSENGILVNTNKSELQQYKKKKMQTVKMEKIESELETLKNDLTEIKDLLKGLVK